MASSDPWTIIHAERKALVDDLEWLTDEQWTTPSLCAQWSVREVLAHMAATAGMTPGKFLGGLMAAGFRFNAMTARDVAKEMKGTPADTLARFKDQLTATTHPPGPIAAMIGESVVHGEDIRRPLGISHAYSAEALSQAASFYGSSNLLIGGKRRIAGLALQATDIDWWTGAGPEVSGPAASLVLAITGREAALEDLSGEGLAALKARM
jgi:uncharacterized protein (TIGR03083 family)